MLSITPRLLFLVSFCCLPLFAQAQPASPVAAADETVENEPLQEYVRIKRNERRAAVALQTSVIHFAKSKRYPNASVDLIGAIHLGETEYYERLNELFTEYDVLLFEAVMPERAVRNGLRPGGGGKRRGLSIDDEWTDAKVGLQAIGILQLGMKDVLGLDFQLSAVDYTPRNFRHADMTQEEFEASMSKRGETFAQIMAREMGKAALQQQKINPVAQQLDMMLSFLATDRRYRLRRIAAVELAKANEGTAFAEADGTSTIITERNVKALRVLKSTLQQRTKKIGIFYGAGHFPDMEKRIVEDFGFERISESWLTAWRLKAPPKKKSR